jgi:hypothetical protein
MPGEGKAMNTTILIDGDEAVAAASPIRSEPDA